MQYRLGAGWITLLSLAWTVGIWLGVPSPDAVAASTIDPKFIHVLNRLSFGPRPGDIDHVRAVGIEAYLQEQLDPDRLMQPGELTQQLQDLETLKLDPSQLLQEYRPQPQRMRHKSKAQKRSAEQKAQKPLREAMQARLLMAISSPRQLEEVMVNFWFNHFNVSATKRTNTVLGWCLRARCHSSLRVGIIP